MALEYLFTGRCAMTDAAGRGAEALIRAGAKELEVAVTLENGETICRRRTPKSHIVELNGNRVPVDAAEAALAKRFGSADVLSAVLNAGRFIEMSEAEQKRLLAQVVEAGKVDIPEEIGNALRAVNEEQPRLTCVADIEAAHKRFYDLRTETSRTFKALGQMEKPDFPSDLPSVQEVKKKLEDLRQQKERLIAQKAEADTCWQNAQARLKQVQAEIEEASAEILSPAQEQELHQLEAQRDQTEKLGQELTELIAEQRTAEKALTAVRGFKDECPMCGQPISAAAKAKETEILGERIADLEGLVQETRGELNDYADLRITASRLESHRQARARRGKLLEEQSRIQAVQKPNTADLDSRMTILSERINRGERVLEQTQQIHSSQERWKARITEKSSLEARIEQLDRLVEFLGPNGAMMEQAKSRIGSFIESLNRQLAAFGYRCNFTLEPFEIRITSSAHEGSGLMLKQLSESERFRFSIAFQIASGNGGTLAVRCD